MIDFANVIKGGGMLKGWLAAVVVAVVSVVGGCSDSGEKTKPVPVGEQCYSDAECNGGFCLDGSCSKHCEQDSDCHNDSAYYQPVCGVDPKGDNSCVPQCDRDQDYVCVDDVSTSCKVAPDSECEKCGCSSAERCEPGVGCMPKRGVGEACESDDDCNTANCSDFAGVCRAPVGAACDATNCDVCLASDNWSYCSRECGSNGECGSGLCLGYADVFYCRPPCAKIQDESCPGGICKVFVDDATSNISYYCDCANSSDCKWLEAAHPLGSTCRYDSDCDTMLCDRVVSGSDSLAGREYEGVCSKPCKASADCGDGYACVDGDAPHCLPTCKDSCAIGSCVSLATTEGASAGLCSLKRATGECWDPGDCLSGNCVANECAPAGGQDNGASCDTGADCKSNSCVGGKCRGSAVLGEACTVPADCAVGTCCTSGDAANTCATTCN